MPRVTQFPLTLGLLAPLLLTAPGRAQEPSIAQEPAPNKPVRATSNADKAPTQAQIQAALARYRHEPSVQEVIASALAHARRRTRDAEALAARARTSGWLPNLRLSARRGQGWDVYEPQTPTATRRLSTGDDLTIEATLTFELSRLLFAREELTVLREQRAEASDQVDLIRTLVELYFERRRLQLERDLMQRRDLARSLRIAHIEALLDAFTDGAFGRMMGR